MERFPTDAPRNPPIPAPPRNHFGLGLLGGFGASVLGIALGIVLGIAMLSSTINSMAGLVLVPLCIFAPPIALAILRGTQRLWHRFWGVVAGLLLGIVVLVGALMVMVSNMKLGGF